VAISDNDYKLLWGRAAGICSKPDCRKDLTVILENRPSYNVGEMAHIIAKKPDGPRGIAEGGSDAYDNLILLCPTCHRLVDKATEGTFPVEILHEWKAQHEQSIRQLNIDQALNIALSISQSPSLTVSSINLILDPPVLEKWRGRAKEIQTLQNWLVNNDVKSIGIQGLSGIGKSWLASYIYEKSLEKSEFNAFFWADVSQMPDFTLFVKNALICLNYKVIDELGGLQDPSQLINEFLKCIRLKKCLIVIDNLETLLDSSRSFIGSYKDFFRGWRERGDAKSKLILTTQVYPLTMEDLGCWLNLQGLDSHNGATLLQELGIQGDLLELKEFSEIMGGHPKILRLVAALLLRDKPKPHIADVEKFGLKNIEATLVRLNIPYRDKERVLFVSILEGHFCSLTKKLQDFLMRLTIYHARSFNWQAAAVVLAKGEKIASIWDTQEALSEVVGRSLLDKLEIKDEYQFRFHPFVWQYLKQKAGRLPESLRDKVITYYQSITNNDRNTWKTLDDVVPYLEIFYHRCEQKQYETAFDTLLICDSFLEIRGYNSIRVELYEQLAHSWKPVEVEEKKFADVLVHLGSAYYFTGQMSLSLKICQKALEIAQKSECRQLEAHALGWMGGCYRRLGNFEMALKLHERAVILAHDVGDYNWEAACLINIGHDYHFLKDYKKQFEVCENALKLAQKIPNRRWEAYAFGGLGFSCQSSGDYPGAIENRKSALSICREIEDYREEGHSLWGLGNAYQSSGDIKEAVGYYQQALQVLKKISDLWSVSLNLESLGELYNSINKPWKALKCYKKILEIQQGMNNSQTEASILEKICEVERKIANDSL
jgi:tetratricopeptide (TPR) repeat protein